MKAIYEAAQTTRQAFCKWLKPSKFEQSQISDSEIVQIALKVRKEYLPGACSREIYYYIQSKLPEYKVRLIGCGKHRFEQVCFANGLRIEHHRFIPKTTERGDFVFENIVSGTTLTDINQVWVSDISYIFGASGTLIGYSTAILDLYSKQLLGLHFSKTMHAAATVQIALEKALKTRGIAKYDNLIFHSDGGKQYIEGNFLKTLRTYGIKSSMAQNCYENASAEAFNDTLKNHMLNQYTLTTYSQLKGVERKIVYCYNYNKPHSSLARKTPIEFERTIANIAIEQRVRVKVADRL